MTAWTSLERRRVMREGAAKTSVTVGTTRNTSQVKTHAAQRETRLRERRLKCVGSARGARSPIATRGGSYTAASHADWCCRRKVAQSDAPVCPRRNGRAREARRVVAPTSAGSTSVSKSTPAACTSPPPLLAGFRAEAGRSRRHQMRNRPLRGREGGRYPRRARQPLADGQMKLRVLRPRESRERRIEHDAKVDVRVISASQSDCRNDRGGPFARSILSLT